MAPLKKTIDKVAKPPVKRIRKAKLPLKTPTVISIKIPVHAESVPGTPLVEEPKLNKKQLSNQIKLDLANEVARAQLVKNQPILFEEPNKQPVARRGRRKKVVSNFFLEDNIAKESPVKTLVLNKKVTQPKTEIKEKLTPKKRQADTATKKPIKRLKLAPQVNSNPTITKSETKTKITRRITRRSCRGKKEDSTTAFESPSITGYVVSQKTDTNADMPEVIDSTPKVRTSPVKSASLIESRKPSLNSTASSGPSWIRDISSTSTTTCVTVSSNEFIRFDHKLPVIKLKNIDSEVSKYKNNDIEDSSSSDSDSDSSDSEQKYSGQLDRCVECPKLSASSSSDSGASNTNVEKTDKMTFFLDKLKSILKKFDMEVINGLRFENEEIGADIKRLKDKVFDIVDNEFGIISHCKNIKRILDPRSGENEETPPVESNRGVQFSATNTHRADLNKSKDMTFNLNVKNTTDVGDSSDSETNELDLQNFTSNKVGYTRYDQCDDDDALSLYAESLTGIDPSRLNSSMASLSDIISDEYTPEPIKNRFISPEKYVYCPTKICDASQSTRPKTICEKQNADSTSIFKESQYDHVHKNIKQNPDSTSIYREAIDKHGNFAEPTANETNIEATYRSHRRVLMLSQFKPIQVTKSIVFKGVCFFNLINSCKKYSFGQSCRFPHVAFDASEIQNRLAKTNEEWFIQEYITMRNWPELRRLYGRCFVHECVRRELTRILVEMALDFVKKANPKSRDDLALKFYVAEITLLHLNKVGFSECEDLLNYTVDQESQLCDFFMDVIAHTQNFSRFKQVFIKLASYMIRNERTFDLTVASAILERVCILPYDEGLARAFLEIVKNTNRNIFDNSMIRHFEKQISSKELYEEYVSVKKLRQNKPSSVVSSGRSPPAPLALAVEPAGSRLEEEAAATVTALSPDTTDYNTMNKSTDEPIITRIIDFNRVHAHNPNVPPTFVDPNSSEPQRVIRKRLPEHLNWNSNVFTNTRQQFRPMRPHFGPQRPMRPMGTPPKLPKRLVTYADSPTRYTPRRPPPNYYE